LGRTAVDLGGAGLAGDVDALERGRGAGALLDDLAIIAPTSTAAVGDITCDISSGSMRRPCARRGRRSGRRGAAS
jgi:hypothetical protein